MTTLQVQYLLAYLGYDVKPDGLMGPQTKAATETFQADYGGITVDGNPGQETQKALRDAVAYNKFRPPDKSEEAGTIWDESPYFVREEFACRCGQYHAPYCDGFPVEPDETLVRLANRIRGNLGRKAHTTSGIRCKQHNADQPNSATNSRHLYGKALDFWVEGHSAAQVLAEVQKHQEVNYAYAVDASVVHMDVK